MPTLQSPLIVAGIDVGGKGKGLHAVALKDGAYHDRCSTKKLADLVAWCHTMQAQVIAIDAPCRWSNDGRARPAERQIMAEGIWCFSTPTCDMALNHPKNHFGWMLVGAEVYRDLTPTHPLASAFPFPVGTLCCFETFPHAITCTLAGRTVSARNKRRDRKALLQQAKIDTTELTNIDLIDAALCAFTAHQAATGKPCKVYGEPTTGLLVVPTSF